MYLLEGMNEHESSPKAFQNESFFIHKYRCKTYLQSFVSISFTYLENSVLWVAELIPSMSRYPRV